MEDYDENSDAESYAPKSVLQGMDLLICLLFLDFYRCAANVIRFMH